MAQLTGLRAEPPPNMYNVPRLTIPSPSRFKRYTRTQCDQMDLNVCAQPVLGSTRGVETVPLVHLIARGRLRGALLKTLALYIISAQPTALTRVEPKYFKSTP